MKKNAEKSLYSKEKGKWKMRVDYELMTAQAVGFLETEPGYVPFLSNLSALIYQTLPDLNWAGFYTVTEDGGLLLGPFQGKPACMVIPVGKGVCGTSVSRKATIVVEDVHAFPGHIACDSASRSEIVIPLWDGQRLIGVMDIDSPILSRFSNADQEGLEAFARVLTSAVDWNLRIL